VSQTKSSQSRQLTNAGKWSGDGPQLSREHFDAVLFDMDGVVTKTASVHTAAWKETFDEFLREKSGHDFKPFSQEDYLKYVDGKPREEGVKSFVASRKISLPEGKPSDPEGLNSINALAKLKNKRFLELVHNKGVEAYETTVALIRTLQEQGFRVAIVTASKNGDTILKAANLGHVFAVSVDGVVASELGLQGKPHPDTFLLAARRLNVVPKRCVVVEDAEAGVEAGKNGHFGLVIGVARSNNTNQLLQHGANVVVTDLAQVSVAGAGKGIKGTALADLKISEETWVLRYQDFVAAEEGIRESLCAVGNGYFCTRAAAPESRPDGVHYPGTYLAGGYNRLQSELEGRSWEREELVNLPNWLLTTFTIDGGAPFDLTKVKILEYEQRLNTREGVVYRQVTFEDEQKRITALSQRWFVHMRHCHLSAIETTLMPMNWSGSICIESGIDGRVLNLGTRVDPKLNVRHLAPANGNVGSSTVELEMITSESQLRIAQAARHTLLINGDPAEAQVENVLETDYVAQRMTVQVSQGDTVTLEKIAALHSSRDRAISQPAMASKRAVESSPPFAALLDQHIEEWLILWNQFDLFVETADQYSKTMPALFLHLNSFHVLQTASPHIGDLDCGIPARGWTGEGYEGHIFWDAMFVFPFINLRMPHITRSLLQYRYRRLNDARRLASEFGARGARFPWQSGSDGREETPKYLWVPHKQIWIEDRSHLEIHVNASIAYNIWQYYQVTQDQSFMYAYGAEMLFEIARFFATFAKYSPEKKRYEILGVVGPDEFHTGYEYSPVPGINNNAYTNVMAAWTLTFALECWHMLPSDRRTHLANLLKLTDVEIAQWDRVSRTMYVPFTRDGIIDQFDGYEDLKEVPRLPNGRMDMQVLERILKEKNDNPNEYRVTKQADVVMLFYLLSPEELKDLFNRLGYPYPDDMIARCLAYYLPVTANKSTLSRIAHGWVFARMDRVHSWNVFVGSCRTQGIMDPEQNLRSEIFSMFVRTLGADYFDERQAAAEGIHMASMAGTVDIVQRAFTGIVTRGDVLFLDPLLPEAIINLSFNLQYRGQALSIEISRESMQVTAHHSDARPIKIGFAGSIYVLNAGDTRTFTLSRDSKAA
jgi:beta-phosphoglucomutase family hydrolase